MVSRSQQMDGRPMGREGLDALGIGGALEFFTKELRKRMGSRLVKVILFGSYAKGLADVDSDVDVLVVHSYPDPDKAMEIVADIALETSLRFNIPLEPIVMTVHEYQQRSLFRIEIERTGKILYTINPHDEARELASEYVFLAEKWLDHAVKDLEIDPRFAIDSAYNAAELAVRAFILLKGESLAKTHGGLIAQFTRLYREVGRDIGRELHEALMLRNRARYDPRAVLTEREARKVIELARKLVKLLRKEIGINE